MDPAAMSVGHGVLKKVHPGPCAIAHSATSSWPANPLIYAGGVFFDLRRTAGQTVGFDGVGFVPTIFNTVGAVKRAPIAVRPRHWGTAPLTLQSASLCRFPSARK
jgi:hypothetical protein